MKNPNPYSDPVTLINSIFNIETDKTYSEEEIEEYEDLYKVDVMECLADYCEKISESEEDALELEDSFLVQYNPDNLVAFFKENI